MVALLVVLLKHKQNDYDTERFHACQTVEDYRLYVKRFGWNGNHYVEAMNIIQDYEYDSIAKEREKAIKAEFADWKDEYGEWDYLTDEAKAELNMKCIRRLYDIVDMIEISENQKIRLENICEMTLEEQKDFILELLQVATKNN